MKLKLLIMLFVTCLFFGCKNDTRFPIPEDKHLSYFDYTLDNPDKIESNDQFPDTVLTWVSNDTIHFKRIKR